jgi:hypothetical protein
LPPLKLPHGQIPFQTFVHGRLFVLNVRTLAEFVNQGPKCEPEPKNRTLNFEP